MFDLQYITCNVRQAIKVVELLGVERDRKEKLMKEILEYLSNANYSKCNPEIMGGTWNIISKHIFIII